MAAPVRPYWAKDVARAPFEGLTGRDGTLPAPELTEAVLSGQRHHLKLEEDMFEHENLMAYARLDDRTGEIWMAIHSFTTLGLKHTEDIRWMTFNDFMRDNYDNLCKPCGWEHRMVVMHGRARFPCLEGNQFSKAAVVGFLKSAKGDAIL